MEDKRTGKEAREPQQTGSMNKVIQDINENKGFVIGEVKNFNQNTSVKDPTTIWVLKNNQAEYKINEKEIEHYGKQLIKNRLIVLHCHDKRITQNTIASIVNYIIDKEKIESSVKRLLSIQRKDDDIDENKPFEENQEAVTPTMFINEDFAKGKTCFVKTKLIQSKFFKSLFVEEEDTFNSIRTELSNKKIFFICYVQDNALLNTIHSKRQSSFTNDQSSSGRNFFFPFYEIPFLPVILQFHFKDRWIEFRDTIVNQREQGYWGNEKTDRELYSRIINYLEDGTDKLKQEIDRRRKQEFRKELFSKVETLPFSQKVHKHILFITAFFPLINVTEFNLLVNILLNGKTREKIVQNTENQPKNDDQVNVEIKSIDLSEEWIQQGDEILNECNIATSALENGRLYFDFEEPELKDEVQIVLKKRYFLFSKEQFQTIINSGIIFDPKTSKPLVQSLLDNLCRMIPYDPNFYGINLLNWLFLKIITNNKIQLKKKIEELNEEELEQVNNYINQQKFEREIGFNRLTDLMSLMLGKEELLSQQVLNFIEYLFQEKQFLVVLRIIESLHNSTRIDAIEWIKRILNQKEAKGDIHYECIQSLYNISNLNTYETFDVLEKIQNRVEGTANHNISLSQANSILLILFIGNPLYGRFPLLHYGKWPSRFFLFNFTKKNISSKWFFLIKWLFHPEMVKAYKIIDNQDTKSNLTIEDILIKVQAFIIESWYLILSGLDKDTKLKPLQKDIIKGLNITLSTHLSPKQKRKIKRQWALTSREYMQEARKFKRKNNPQLTALYTAKKETCRILFNQLNN